MMNDHPAKNRKKIAVDDNDVALIFKEDGHIDLSFPELKGKEIPDHVMAALALSYAVVDEEFFNLIQDRFEAESQALLKATRASEKKTTVKKVKTPKNESPHLRIVS